MFDILLKLIHELMFLAGYVGGSNAFPKQLSAEEEKKYIDLFCFHKVQESKATSSKDLL